MPLAKDTEKPLYLAIHKLIIYMYSLVHNFPKEYKYTLGKDILDMSWKTLDFVILTNTIENKEKYKYIEKTIALFNSLKYRIRIGYELKIISSKQYSFILKQAVQINKMLKGWYTWSKRI
jgi:hypothetical protein